MRRLGLAFSLVMGAALTFALLYLMQQLLVADDWREDAEIRVRSLDSTLSTSPGGVVVDPVLPRRIPEPASPPRIVLHDSDLVDATAGASRRPVARGTESEAAADAEPAHDYLPIVKVAAFYPRRAQAQGVTGYCVVEFTVTTSGAVRDPRAVDCQPPGVFEASSLRAVQRFKYRPRTVDGHPVEVDGVRNRFVFELGR